MKSPVIEYDSVDICYDGKQIVQEISFSVQEGEILGIVGESGSGKSTVIKSAMQLLGPGGIVTRGDIWFQGYNMPDVDDETLRRLCGSQISMIFQDAGASFCPIRTIGSQLYEAVAAHRRGVLDDVRAKALSLFKNFGFSDGKTVWDSYPFELSGGMNQRAAIVMNMLLTPRLLLCDEPTSALDTYVQRQVLNELLRLRDECGTAMIIVTHDMSVVSRIADSLLVLRDGRIVEYGAVRQVLSRPRCEYTRQLVEAVPKLRR